MTQWAVGTEEGLLACYDATFDEVDRHAARLTRSGAAAEDLTHVNGQVAVPGCGREKSPFLGVVQAFLFGFGRGVARASFMR